MRLARLFRLLFVLGLVATGAGPGFAQQPPVCEAKYAGAMSCQSGARCKCAFFRGGLMMAEPEGYRWDCSPLYGSCHTDVPATTSRHEGGARPSAPSAPPGTVIVPGPGPGPIPFPPR